jgi:Flp pilus assembly protein TadG
MIRPEGRTHRRTGATVVETAIVIGAALMFMLAIYEYGRFVMIHQAMENAAREGARYAVVHTGDNPPPNIPGYVLNYMGGQDVKLTGYSASVYQADITTGNALPGNWYDAPFGAGIAVQINGTYNPVVLGLLVDAINGTGVAFMNPSVPMQATSIMRSEAN